ncbi:uncharacterized protein [Dermacentor albipictus]|uniref:uncharacterized protein n=1 Tax=Dermacentor albipictus TaxID=60249 RepID=UPI0038FD2038
MNKIDESEHLRVIAAPDVAARVIGRSRPSDSSASLRASGTRDGDMGRLDDGAGLSWELKFRILIAGVCLLLLALFLLTEYATLHSANPEDDVEGEVHWNTTARAALTSETDEYTTDAPWFDHTRDGGAAADMMGPPMFRWVRMCETPECVMQRRWLVYMMKKQVDPCWETNAFVCDGTRLPSMEQPIPLDANDTSDDMTPSAPVPSTRVGGLLHTTPRAFQQPYPSNEELHRACLNYVSQKDDGVSSVRQFMAQFGLDLGSLKTDSSTDLMYTMTQLSFEYGVHSLLAMDRAFSLVADPARPFTVLMNISGSASELFAQWEKVTVEDWTPYYKGCLEVYGLTAIDTDLDALVAELIARDKEIAEAHRAVLDKPQQDKEHFTLDVAGEHIGVSPDFWLASIRLHGRTDYDLSDGVRSTEAILSVAAAALRDEDKSMSSRKVVSWHLIRSLMGHKKECLAAFKTALDTAGEKPALDTPEEICKMHLGFTETIHGEAIGLIEGPSAIPIARMLHITRMMARLQQTAAAIIRGPLGLRLISADASEVASMTFPESTNAHSSQAPRFFAGVDTIPQGGFVADWLRRLRAWHVLPPVFQAHLKLLAEAVSETLDDTVKTVGQLFEPPYYYDDGLAAYNYAVLGQIISYQIAEYIKSKITEDEKANWKTYWENNDALDYKSVYCLFYSNETTHGHSVNKNGGTAMSRSHTESTSHDGNSSTAKKKSKRQTHYRIDEALFDEEKQASHIRGSRIAYTTFQALPSMQRQVLPSVQLSPAQLFLVAHCAFSCTRASPENAHKPANALCMVIFIHSRGLASLPCGHGRDRAFGPCTYA